MPRIVWTENEDTILFNACKIHGKKWRMIAKLLPGRSDDSIRNRALRKRFVEIDQVIMKNTCKLKIPNLRQKWEEAEDDIILDFVIKYGKKWDELTDYLHDRTSHAIRNRYFRIMNKNYWESYIDVDLFNEYIYLSFFLLSCF